MGWLSLCMTVTPLPQTSSVLVYVCNSLICVASQQTAKNTGVTDEIIKCYKTEYSSLALAEVMDADYRNDWILVTRYRIGK